MFKITQGKGIHIKFENGYEVSIQFGWGDYCSNRDENPPHNYDYLNHQQTLGKQGSYTAEVAIINSTGAFDSKQILAHGDEVEGWCSPERVVEILKQVADLMPVDTTESYISDNPMFKSLDVDEVADYKKWARDNYVVGTEINSVWHPVIQAECRLMNEVAENNIVMEVIT